MKKLASSLLTLGLLSLTPSAAHAVERPGQFCAKSKLGKVIKSSDYGQLKCTKYPDGRARWKRA